MADLTTHIGEHLVLKNPVMTASGTFGYGLEYADLMDISRLGAIIVKGTTAEPRQGNPYPRMAETPAGMLNAVGLQNRGVDYFVDKIYPAIRSIDTAMIVNVGGSTVETYMECAEKIAALDDIPAIELNISCPNVKQGGIMRCVRSGSGAYCATCLSADPDCEALTECDRHHGDRAGRRSRGGRCGVADQYPAGDGCRCGA